MLIYYPNVPSDVQPTTPESGDPGDEDDTSDYRLLTRSIWKFRFFWKIGKVLCVYPARVLPTLPDHDPGDEQSRLERKYPDDI